MRKDDIRQIFDGSIFYRKAKEYEESTTQDSKRTSPYLAAQARKLL
jgi:hypothetical protein